MGCGDSKPNPPPMKPVPSGKTRICMAGYKISHNTGKARKILGMIASKYPNEYESWYYFDSGGAYEAFLKEKFDPIPFPPHLKGHATSPFVWLERGEKNDIEPIGGYNHLAEWVSKNFPQDPELVKFATEAPSWGEAFHNGKEAAQSTADVKVTL